MMASLLNLFTPDNLVYADRARGVRATSVYDDPAHLFEVVEPGLRVHAAFESYEGNSFLCEHPDGAGWSCIDVAAPCDFRGQSYRLKSLGWVGMRDALFEAWLRRPAPKPLVALFEQEAAGVSASDLSTTADEEDANLLMLLRVGGTDGEALRTLIALGRFPDFDLRDVAPGVLTGEIENLTLRHP